jgi:anti-sigma B factor antagonist
MTTMEQIFAYKDSAPSAVDRLQRSVVSALSAGRRVMLDLDQLPVLDNPALRGLIVLLRRAREVGGNLVLRATRADLRQIIALTALDRLFEVAPC